MRWIPAVALLVLAAACGGPADAPSIASADPPHGPLVGGTRITLRGSGFASPGAGPNRVLIGGREAPLVATVDDTTLELLIPPGDQPGDADILVLNDHGNARATGVFRYSTAPRLTGVTPPQVTFDSFTTMTVTGSGFLDEGAGTPTVILDGLEVNGVFVLDDTHLTFRAPSGRALDEPDLELVNGRGQASIRRAFRRVPSANPGLLLFPHDEAFAAYFNPISGELIVIPWIDFQRMRLSAVVRDDRGDYWGVEGSRYGRIDFKTQQLEFPIDLSARHPTMIRVGDAHFAIDRNTRRFGQFHPATGTFTPIGVTPVPCCGSYGLASDGTTMYMVSRTAGVTSINTVDPVTGVFGTPVPIVTSPFHVEEMRFFNGVLYASNTNGTIVTIDPANGDTTVFPFSVGRIHAMEVFE